MRHDVIYDYKYSLKFCDIITTMTSKLWYQSSKISTLISHCDIIVGIISLICKYDFTNWDCDITKLLRKNWNYVWPYDIIGCNLEIHLWSYDIGLYDVIACLGKTITWVWTVIDPYEIILKCFELIAETIAKFIISLLNFTHLFAQWCCLLLLAVLQQLLSWSPTPRTGLCKSIWLSQHLIYGNMAVQASIILAFAWRSLNL